MGNVPMSSVLGISMMTFGALVGVAGVKAYNSRVAALPDSMVGPGELVAWIIALFCVLPGALIYVINLDMDPCIKSGAFGFLGANIGVGWIYWTDEEDWVDLVPAVVGLVFVGLVLGLLLSEGDVQKETKERWRREEETTRVNHERAMEKKNSEDKKESSSK